MPKKTSSWVSNSQAQNHKLIERFIKPYRITSGKDFRLKNIDPRDTGGLNSEDKPQAKELLARGVDWLAEQQDMLYAQDHWAVLLVFQAMDAAGKDGTIKHVTSGINPQGCTVTSYKQPSSEELDHDYLWRYMRNVPARGQTGAERSVWRPGPRSASASKYCSSRAALSIAMTMRNSPI
jgi:polyphosphate kinase 2 (PPK2 family)